MILAQITDGGIPTTLTGVAVFGLAMIVITFFADRKKNERDVQKTRNLEEQTSLMRELVEQGRKSQKGDKKTRKLLKVVNSTVSAIRTDQIEQKKL